MIDPMNDDDYVVMPFVLTQKHGGEYDTEAFSAGWHLGMLDSRLGVANMSDLLIPTLVLKTSWKAQVDLIAMSHELVVKTSIVDDDPEYSYYTIAPSEFFRQAGL